MVICTVGEVRVSKGQDLKPESLRRDQAAYVFSLGGGVEGEVLSGTEASFELFFFFFFKPLSNSHRKRKESTTSAGGRPFATKAPKYP